MDHHCDRDPDDRKPPWGSDPGPCPDCDNLGDCPVGIYNNKEEAPSSCI